MKYECLPPEAKRIPNSLTWVTPNGELYGVVTATYKNGQKHKDYGCFFKYTLRTNGHNGYVYGPVKYYVDESHTKTVLRNSRVHILVAKAFIENPNSLCVVGHRNNIKHDNRVENLYWTTIKENTQKAYDDGLAVNAKGRDDSQSKPVVMFDTKTNQELGRYGSILEASSQTGILASTIARQAKYKRPVQRPFYFRYENDESVPTPRIVIRYDIETGKELGRFVNFADASQATGVSPVTIRSECVRGVPIRRTTGSYFSYNCCPLGK